MKFKQLRIIINFPFKPKVKYEGHYIKPSYKELWLMYGKSDYVCRVINQIYDGSVLEGSDLTVSVVLTTLYTYVHKCQNYYQLSETIKKIIWKKWL